MIAKLKGKIESLETHFLYLNVNEIVYEIHINFKTYINLQTKDHSTIMDLFIHHLISERIQRLYGFLQKKEKDFFKLLTSLNGIGETIAMKILSTYSIEEIYAIIKSNNSKSFEKISKIKEKTSSKIFFELQQKQDKIKKFIDKDKLRSLEGKEVYHYQTKDLVITALLQLGLDEKQANQKFQLIHQKHPNLTQANEFITEILKNY